MKLKTGVKLKDLSPQMVLGANIIDRVYMEHSHNPTVTSCNDGKHSETSLHYSGNALDWRTKDFYGDKQALVYAIKDALGSNFDVVLEALGTDNEHIHTEYQPK